VGQKTFPSPEDASRALFVAVQDDDQQALMEIFGAAGRDLISSGDAAEDTNSRHQFVQKYQEMHRRADQGGTRAKTVAPDEVDAFVAIDPSGGVTLYLGKVDLGTGVHSAMTQIVAEELDVPLARVEVIEGDTALAQQPSPAAVGLSRR
jgi:CO/xanthine dehydrogenase Mo-binding subunit